MIYQKSQNKDIVSDKEVLVNTVSSTLDTMAKVVGATLGPGGRPVLIERDGLAPLVTKDGVTVAKSLGMSDASKNIVVDAAKEICINTAAEAGDGTTTAIVLANALVKMGQEFLQNNPKYNPQRLVSELHHAYDTVLVPYLNGVSRTVGDDEDLLLDVATISANGDKEIADAAVEAVMAAGDDGHVQIVEGKERTTKVDTVNGYVMTSGLKELGQIGPVFINDKAAQKVLMDNGHVFLYNGRLNDLAVPAKIQDVVTDEGGYSDGKPIIVIANDFADSVLDKFAKTTKGGLTIVPVKTPRSGLPNGASIMLDDLAAYTGAEVYDPGTIDQISDIGIGEFVEASINMYESFIVSESDPDDIENRIVELKAIEEAAFSEYDKAHIRAGIAKLTGGIATILVGGSSDLEIREKKDRTEDAVEAVRSAISEGIVSGGCSTHLIMASLLEKDSQAKESWYLLAKALRAPFTRLLENCGEDEQTIVVKLANEYENCTELPSLVFDARSHTFVDPFKTGIIEPSKVVRVSVGNALSVAALLITLGGIVVVPSNPEMEAQLALGKQAFDQMMSSAQE